MRDRWKNCLNLRKIVAHSESLMSKLFETTTIRMEALSNSFENAVKSMSDAVTGSMKELHSAMSTLATSVTDCQKQEKKDEERRSKNVIISGLELQPGCNDKDMVLSLCENHLTVKPTIARTRRIGNHRLCVTLDNSSAAEDLIASLRILRSSSTTKGIFINPDLSKRQAEQAFLIRQERRRIRTTNNNSKNAQPFLSKQNDLNLFLSVYRPEIFSVIETWLTPNDPDNLFLPSGYSFVRRDRATRGGGVAFIINDTIQYKIVSIPSQFSHIEIVSIDVSISKKNYRFISYYRSGGFDKSAEEYAFDSARCIKELSKGDVICISYYRSGGFDKSAEEYAFDSARCIKELSKIENVQRRFTKFIPSIRHLPYLSRLQAVGLQTLERRRLVLDLCLLYIYGGLTSLRDTMGWTIDRFNLINTDLNGFFIPSHYLSTRSHPCRLQDFNAGDNNDKDVLMMMTRAVIMNHDNNNNIYFDNEGDEEEEDDDEDNDDYDSPS
ncbi:hypothetical protein HELRODRAFT_164349 [Helobdella robusta]|uniref:Uncharacterized protein n=1 Tax=Helobdella robusta TaxID=6412 RepID=T1EVA8_HELRO|nr:hypothetical protein HELRODRAFT_164349 [Helobdella robusta]ESN94492.1 hypothetical protein HELRODRAFT_164349 [Helobdella robusta]